MSSSQAIISCHICGWEKVLCFPHSLMTWGMLFTSLSFIPRYPPVIFILSSQAITFIFKSLGVKGVPYLAQVVPSLLTVIRTSDANFRDFLFQQLATLIGIVKQHIRNYLDGIIKVLKVRQVMEEA